MKHRDKIIEYFEGLEASVVVCANSVYEQHFTKMSQPAFFKALERLVTEGVLIRISKGMYAKAETKAVQEEAVLNYYFGEDNDNGLYIGYKLYQKYSITQIDKEDIYLYSNLIKKQTSNIGRVHIKYTPIELSYDNARVVEALEILQAFDSIEGLNKQRFAVYARQFALGYKDSAAVYVLNNMKYKKSTIAFMRKILDMYKIPNSLGQFLSCSTRYKLPAVQRLAK